MITTGSISQNSDALNGFIYSSNLAGVCAGANCYYFGSFPPHQWTMASFFMSNDSGLTWTTPGGEWFPPGPDLPDLLL